MSVHFNTSPEKAEATWKALCAKAGLPEAANIGTRSTHELSKAERHQVRKTARNAINTLQSAIKPNELDDATTDALVFAGGVVAAINQAFEREQDAEQFFGKK
ncbi:MAG TPA: hypothetical protein VMS38_03630 [Pseudorhodoferax sp.]|nr:hypothetical protein [Pseudorhodoferax sp.]